MHVQFVALTLPIKQYFLSLKVRSSIFSLSFDYDSFHDFSSDGLEIKASKVVMCLNIRDIDLGFPTGNE